MIAKRAWFYIKLVAAAVFLVAAAIPLLYVAQTNGVCLKMGRVLDAGELRRRVLLNFIDYNIQNTILLNKGYGSDSFWLGIASPAQETDTRKLVEISFHHEKPIEENFGLEMLVRGRKDIPASGFDLNGVVEPFLLMGYDLNLNWGGTYVSSDTQEIQVTNKQLGGYEPTLYERFLGYGNHYFFMPSLLIAPKCCDNRKSYYDKSHNDEYLKKKRRAYIDTMSSLDFQTKLAVERTVAAVVSNCGALLLTELNDPGFSHDIIQRVWIKGE
jgi:hypothetical protein